MTKEEFKKIRIANDFTQKQLSEIIELKTDTITKIERGDRNITALIAKIMRNLDAIKNIR